MIVRYINAEESEKLALAKEAERHNLNALLPEDAQAQVESIFYPKLWKPKLSPCWGANYAIQPESEQVVDEKAIAPAEVRDLLVKLTSEVPDLVLVGGQAVNFWSIRYYEDCEAWNELRPFTSEDIDFLGSPRDAQKIGLVLQGEVFINRNFESSPNAGIVLVKHRGRQLRIDVLGQVLGVDEEALAKNAIEFVGERELEGLTIKLIDPLLALESKLASLHILDQRSRQDLKHTKLCVRVLEEFLREHWDILSERVRFGIIERVFDVASQKNALHAWFEHGIEVEQGLPWDLIDRENSNKFQRFNTIRKPQLEKHVAGLRKQYKTRNL